MYSNGLWRAGVRDSVYLFYTNKCFWSMPGPCHLSSSAAWNKKCSWP